MQIKGILQIRILDFLLGRALVRSIFLYLGRKRSSNITGLSCFRSEAVLRPCTKQRMVAVEREQVGNLLLCEI